MIALIYIITFSIMPKGFWGLDNGYKYQGAQAFSNNGQIDVPYAGSEFDPEGRFRPIVRPFGLMIDNRQFPVFSILFMMVTGSLISFLGRAGAFLLPLAGGILTLLASWYMWVCHRGRNDGRLFLLLVGLGSPLFFYSFTLWEHSIATALIICATTFVNRGKYLNTNAKIWKLVLSGLLFSIAALFRSESIIWMLVVLLLWNYTNHSKRTILFFLSGLAFGLMLNSFFNNLITESWLPLHIISNLKSQIDLTLVKFIAFRSENFFNLIFQGFEHKLLSILIFIPFLFLAFGKGWRRRKEFTFWILASVLCSWFFYILKSLDAPYIGGYMSNNGGLLWAIPMTVLSVRYFSGERRRFWKLIWLGSIIYILITSLATPISKGVHWGPRLLIPIIPFLLIIASIRLERWWRQYSQTRLVLVALVLITLVNQGYSISTLYITKSRNLQYANWIDQSVKAPTMTNVWWMLGDIGVSGGSQDWYYAKTLTAVQEITNELQKSHIGTYDFLELSPFIDDELWDKINLERTGQISYPHEDPSKSQLRLTKLKFKESE